jgi:tetratricopeptide (TPR) repeat protein
LLYICVSRSHQHAELMHNPTWSSYACRPAAARLLAVLACVLSMPCARDAAAELAPPALPPLHVGSTRTSAALTTAVAVADAVPAAQTYFSEGLALVQRQRYRDAIRLFHAAARADARLAEAYFNLGACYERLDEFAAAIPWYEKAIALDPRNEQFHYLYGTALLRHAQPARAVGLLERAAYLAPTSVETLYYLGMTYVAVTQYALAATSFETLAGAVTNSSEAWYNVGLARLYAGQTSAAVQAFNHVDLDAPMAAQAHYHLGTIAADAGDVTGALRAAKMALALAPGMPDAEELLAASHARMGDYQAACAAYERLHVLRPAERTERALGAACAAWAAQAMTQQRFALALDRYQQAARYLPDDAEIQVQLARCAAAAQRDDVARDAIRRARRLATTTEQEERLQAVARALARRAPSLVDKQGAF